ncbi:PSD1 and planctomycete cytochrome C domain-containing protein [Candidatus Laterigemmans baculatus]|uniref:PSD1 and planctomycete cytochrome C domain-containing protein n=1 Tax=Candidatus Laterigemmans baculatus TaxID=2770505 RepID=UPI001F35CD58|nr:PSD1 and planctomycete cytochrome C domain-containing protein [Candidatus Laterigemmans baculatus]
MAATLPLAVRRATAADEADRVEFARDVQPILRRHCYECHDGEKQTSGYRVDVRSIATGGGESGAVGIVPGSEEESELLRRIVTDDPYERMPPEGDGVSAAEVEILRRWIASGATWPEALANEGVDKTAHWAFQAPQRPTPPAQPAPLAQPEGSERSLGADWCVGEIDRFVLARLAAAGLSPSPEADRVTLCRRLYLDLTGLPPTPEEIDRFLADDRPDAYERLVDSLLAAPAFGERWATPWLDAARYADSDGYEKDKQRQVWFYRDWVIAALNEDLPYDEFLIHQLAGDQIPEADQQSRVATGFVRHSMVNEEGGADPEQFRMEAMFDRMDALGKAVLGLTIACAQCHNHKFDPISQEEYFQLMAYLNNDHDANIPVYTPPQQQQRDAVLDEIAALEAELKAEAPDWRERIVDWEATLPPADGWRTAAVEWHENTSGGQKFIDRGDGSLLAQGYAPTKFAPTFTMRLSPDQLPIRGLRLELLLDPNLPHFGPGRSVFGTAALSEIQVRVTPRGTAAGEGEEAAKPYDVQWQSASADIDPPEAPLDSVFSDRTDAKRITGPVAFAIDGDPLTAWGTDLGPGRRNQPRQAVFVPREPIQGGPEGVELEITLTQRHGGWNSDDNQSHNLGRFRFAVTSADAPQADPLPHAARASQQVAPPERSAEEWDALFSAWRKTRPEWSATNERFAQLWKEHPEPASQLVLMPQREPRETFVLKRGDFLSPVREVEPGVPEVLNPLPEEADGSRLTLARWLTSPKAPTTSRAIVNRIWQSYFGVGLVETPEDLGTQSAPPSHPELLDWLAVELVEGNWSQKRIHREIVMSAAYRQRSTLDAELREADPTARLVSRRARQRVAAETIRDIALASSGLIDRRIGGRPTYPPLPDWMLQPPVSYGPKNWYESQGGERYRRGLYTHRYRSLPYPTLQVFDAPNGEASCVRRPESNTPLQALALLNEPTINEAARALAARLLRECGEASDRERLRYAMRLCVGRTPDESELEVLHELLAGQRERLAAGELDAQKILAGEAAPLTGVPADADPQSLAAWTLVSRVLLNLDETITRP